MTVLLNIGSIQKIQIAHSKFVPANFQNPVSTVTEWTDIPFTQQTAPYTMNSELKNPGVVFKHELSFSMPKLSPEKQALANEFVGKPIVILVTDGNSRKLLIGNKDNPAYMNYSASVPKMASGYNGYSFAIACLSKWGVLLVE